MVTENTSAHGKAIPPDLSSALSDTPCWTSWNTTRRLEETSDRDFGSIPPSLLSALHRDDEVERDHTHETAPARWPSASLQNTKGNAMNETDHPMGARLSALPTTPLNRLKCWFSNMLAARATLSELSSAGDEEIGRIAHDFNMSVSELRALAQKGPQAAALLEERLAQLGLEPVDSPNLDPALARDLQRICSMCDAQRQCSHELEAHDTSDHWKRYCPNSQTLEALKNNPAA